MIDILLVSAPSDEKLPDGRSGENLGMLYLEASLKKAGYKCSIIDGLTYNLYAEDMLKEILHNHSSLFIGFSTFINNIANTIKMIRDMRERGFREHITMGGMWPSFKYKEILTNIKEVDSVCVGEGEEVIVELAECLSEGRSIKNIRGLACKDENNSIIFCRRKLKDNIDDFSVPDRKGYYFDVLKDRGEIGILFSRGCHGGCSFCNISSYIKLCGGKAWRHRNVKKVIDEMEYLVHTTGINCFRFVDDNFLGPSDMEREKCFLLAEEIIKRRVNLEFVITSRVEGVEYKLFKKLKEAGLIHINLGVESWVDEQLKRYNKRVSIKENLNAIKILDHLHIPYYCFIIPFDPYVTREEVKQNLDMIGETGLKHTIHTHFTNHLAINQYQPVFKRCLEDNLIENFNINDIDNGELQYRQFYTDVQSIIEAGKAVDELFYKCLSKLMAKKKEMPIFSPQWFRVQREIIIALQKKFYDYFCEYVYSNNTEGGRDFIYSTMGSVYENISSFIEKITGEDMTELNEHIINIDGIKISTRPEGFNEFISSIVERGTA